MRGIAGSLLVALLATVPAAAEEQVTWLTMDFPPFYIHRGAARGQGIADQVARRIEGRMPGFTFRDELAAPAAIMARMKAGDHVCSAAYIRTPEREKVLTFSLPNLILPPNGVTIRRESLARFGGGGAISLATLLADRELKGAVAVGRSYGPALDALLERHKRSPHLYWRQGTDIYASLFDMLAKGSVDYVLGYPYEALFLARERGLAGKVTSLRLTEAPDFTFAHVVCPKNEWGARVISAIDRALRAERPLDEYRQAIERWLDPELQEEFRRQYTARFLAADR